MWDLLLRIVEDCRPVRLFLILILLVDFEDAGLPHIPVPDNNLSNTIKYYQK